MNNRDAPTLLNFVFKHRVQDILFFINIVTIINLMMIMLMMMMTVGFYIAFML